MTRRNAPLWALAAAGVGTLLWCAWLILSADLPRGSSIAAWALWLLAVAAWATFVAYARELTRSGVLRRGGSWKPLPGLVLLWIAGGTAAATFAFILPGGTSAPTGQVRSSEADVSLTVATPQPDPTTTTSPAPTATPRVDTTSVARARQRSAPAPTVPVVTPTPVSTTAQWVTPTRQRTNTPKPPKVTTTTPILDLTISPKPGRPTTKPPHTK